MPVDTSHPHGKSTHDQQIQIIEKRVNTKNAGDDFDAEADLKMSPEQREARRKGASLRAGQRDLVDPDDRNMLRGEHQESEHHKERQDDEDNMRRQQRQRQR
jgi:hypothetical protein